MSDPRQIWPSKAWYRYWKYKRHRCRTRGIPFELTREECLSLCESAPELPSPGGVELCRHDHDKGYTTENCFWDTGLNNRREQNTRMRIK